MKRKLILPSAALLVLVIPGLLGVISLAQVFFFTILFIFFIVLWQGVRAGWRDRHSPVEEARD